MNYNLVMDVGNTSITWAVFQNSRLKKKGLLKTNNFKSFRFPVRK
jgi:pantothenate kinase type III